MFDGISPAARAWLLIIAMIIFFGGGAASASAAGGASLGWCIVAGLSAGFGQIVTALMKSPQQAREQDAREGGSVPPFRPDARMIFVLLSLSLCLTACAAKWIDKVSQTRAASTKLGYRAGAEYNAWLQPRTNNPAAFHTTYGALMTGWTNVDFNARQLGRSALLLESLEDTYRATPTNQSAIVAVVNDLALQSSNLNVIVKGIVTP